MFTKMQADSSSTGKNTTGANNSASTSASSSASVETRTILVVEDQPAASQMISMALGGAGFHTQAAASGQAAISLIAREMPDLILLDLHLPDMHGLEVLRFVRARSSVPVITMSGHAERGAMISTLENGADDYVFKPFIPDELIARIRALLRRVQRTPVPEVRLQVRGLELDITRRQATMRGQKLMLTPTEYGILAALMRNAGQTIRHEDLLRLVWGGGTEAESPAGAKASEREQDYSVLRVNISRLRQKLEENPRHPNYIVTVPGEGYTIPTGR